MPTGRTALDFGVAPGSLYTSVTVTGQTDILSGSRVEAWITPIATADHLADEHMVDPPRVIAGNIVAGTGFTIHGFATGEPIEAPTVSETPPGDVAVAMHHGLYTVDWAWV